MVILETERLKLRQWTLEDVSRVAPIYADADVMRYIGAGLPYSHEQTAQGMAKTIEQYRKLGYGMWAAEFKDSGEIVGQCGLKYWGAFEEIEIGYLLAKTYWGQGLAIEAAEAVKDYAFEQLKLDSLIAVIYAENLASIRVAEKLGMQLDRTVIMLERPVVIYKVQNH